MTPAADAIDAALEYAGLDLLGYSPRAIRWSDEILPAAREQHAREQAEAARLRVALEAADGLSESAAEAVFVTGRAVTTYRAARAALGSR